MTRLEALAHPIVLCIAGLALVTFWWLAELLADRRRDAGWRVRTERALPLLEVLVAVQPLLGLLGTLSGLLDTFRRMSLAGGLERGELVGGGIAVAMVTTQAGLLMAIPGLVGTAMLRSRWRTASIDAGLRDPMATPPGPSQPLADP